MNGIRWIYIARRHVCEFNARYSNRVQPLSRVNNFAYQFRIGVGIRFPTVYVVFGIR